jgi:predicted nucleic acid-binding protein
VSRFVLDASVAGAWLLEDEDDPIANAAMSRLATECALVPQLWHLEVRNTLVVAERRGRVGAAALDAGLRRVGELPIRTDSEPDLGTALALARRRRLTIYDALYLELALRADAPLATVDRALANAAMAEECPLIDLPAGL